MFYNINKEHFGKLSVPATYFLMMEEITNESCQRAISWIIESNLADDNAPEVLNLMLCTPGGDLHAAFALIDVMRGSKIPVRTIGIGQIASAGLLIFIAGQKNMRILTENTSILSHQYSAGSIGKEHELLAAVREFDLITGRVIKHYKKFSKLDEKSIRKYLLPPQDIWLSADEAVKYGLADEIKNLK
jgi:ATP-dependent Clp protease protease subunit